MGEIHVFRDLLALPAYRRPHRVRLPVRERPAPRSTGASIATVVEITERRRQRRDAGASSAPTQRFREGGGRRARTRAGGRRPDSATTTTPKASREVTALNERARTTSPSRGRGRNDRAEHSGRPLRPEGRGRRRRRKTSTRTKKMKKNEDDEAELTPQGQPPLRHHRVRGAPLPACPTRRSSAESTRPARSLNGRTRSRSRSCWSRRSATSASRRRRRPGDRPARDPLRAEPRARARRSRR